MRRVPFRLLLGAAVALLFCLVGGLPGGAASQARAALRPGDELWIVSTRDLHTARGWPRYERLVDGCWRTSTRDEFLASFVAQKTTDLYVHGNWVDRAAAYEHAGRYYRFRVAPGDPPLRIVVWSWPSDRQGKLLRDVRTKAARCDLDAVLLARWLARLPEPRVSLTGFSYGARIIVSALHLRGGGCVDGQTVAAADQISAPLYRVTLWAAAADTQSVSPAGSAGCLWRVVERALLLYNSNDPVLKRYRFVERFGHPAALGYTGFPTLPSAARGRAFSSDVARAVGETHDSFRYFGSAAVRELTRRNDVSAVD